MRFRILTVIGKQRAALAAFRHGHFFAENARGVVPLERFRVVARNAGEPFVVDLAQPLRRLAAAAAGGLDVDLDRVVALALLLERERLLEKRVRAGRSASDLRPLGLGPGFLGRSLCFGDLPVCLGFCLFRGRPGIRDRLLRRGFLLGRPGRGRLFRRRRALQRLRALGRGRLVLRRLRRIRGLLGLGVALARGRIGALLRFLGARAILGELLLGLAVAAFLRLVLRLARLLERDARFLRVLLRLLRGLGLALRLLELLLHRCDPGLLHRVVRRQEIPAGGGNGDDQGRDPDQHGGRGLLAARDGLRLELGLALLELGLALGALLGLLLRQRLGLFLDLLFGLAARLGFGFGALLVLGLALRELRGRFLLRLLGCARRFLARFFRGLGLRLGFGLALRLTLLELFLLARQLELEPFLLLGELGARLGLAARGFLGLAPLLLLRLGAGLVLGGAAQLRDLALGERGVDAVRELLDVELEVVGVVAVLDRAPELELDFLVRGGGAGLRAARAHRRGGTRLRRRAERRRRNVADHGAVGVLFLAPALQRALQRDGEILC